MSIDQEKLQLAKKVLDVLLKTERKDGFYDHMNMDNWEWPVGVALYCMFKIYKKTGDLDFYNALIDWYDKQLQKEPPHRNVNTVAPMLTMVCLYEENKNPVYLEHIESWINWVMNEMPRTEYGGMQHMTVWNRHNQQLWDDTLFMTVLFLAKAGKVLGSSTAGGQKQNISSCSILSICRTSVPVFSIMAGRLIAGIILPMPSGRAATAGLLPVR